MLLMHTDLWDIQDKVIMHVDKTVLHHFSNPFIILCPKIETLPDVSVIVVFHSHCHHNLPSLNDCACPYPVVAKCIRVCSTRTGTTPLHHTTPYYTATAAARLPQYYSDQWKRSRQEIWFSFVSFLLILQKVL